MIKKICVAILFVFLFSTMCHSQCDTTFFPFKRAIINVISKQIDSLSDFFKFGNGLILEFSDFKKFKYSVSDEKGFFGFTLFREEACNNYKDSFCIKRFSKDYKFPLILSDKSLFENFMSSDSKWLCDSLNYLHTNCKLIEDPIIGWYKLEDYFFKRVYYIDKSLLHKNEIVFLDFPIYIYLDKELKEIYLVNIKISGCEIENIKIENINTIFKN